MNRSKSEDIINEGDLVMAMAKEIDHPAYKIGQIDRGCILFGTVVDTVLGPKEEESFNVHWMTTFAGMRFMDAQSGVIPRKKGYESLFLRQTRFFKI